MCLCMHVRVFIRGWEAKRNMRCWFCPASLLSLPFYLTYALHIVAAGVIGIRRWRYHIWGDTVELAHKMEGTSEPLRCQISESTLSYLQSPDEKWRISENGEVVVGENEGEKRTKKFFVDPL